MAQTKLSYWGNGYSWCSGVSSVSLSCTQRNMLHTGEVLPMQWCCVQAHGRDGPHRRQHFAHFKEEWGVSNSRSHNPTMYVVVLGVLRVWCGSCVCLCRLVTVVMTRYFMLWTQLLSGYYWNYKCSISPHQLIWRRKPQCLGVLYCGAQKQVFVYVMLVPVGIHRLMVTFV